MELAREENKMFKSVKEKLRPILIILLIYIVWSVAVFVFIIIVLGFDDTLKHYGSGNMFLINTLQSTVKGTLVFYFLIYQVIIPLIKTRQWRKYLFRSFIFFLFLTMYEVWFYYKISDPIPVEGVTMPLRTFLTTAVVLDIIILLVSIFAATLITTNEMRKRRDNLEKEKLKAELSAIKYQINPHFLFNSLSFIYTKTVKENSEAAHAVHLLSEIMSYALDDWDELGTVPLGLEAEQIKRVIEMNQIRFNRTLNIKYYEYIEPQDAYIPLLCFVTLVENAFKHGDLNDENNPIMIKLEASKNKIYFKVSNKKRKDMMELSHGIGLSNVKQRLQLMYGDNQTVSINDGETHYSIEITIKL